MSKKLKSILLVVAMAVVTLLAICSNVFAASTTYSSYIDMSAGNTTLTGSTRKYDQRNHKISFYVTSLSGSANVHTSLHKKNLFNSTTVQETNAYFDSTYKTYTYYMGNHDTGKYYYFFSTLGAGRYGSFTADPVNMTSYD